MPLDHSAPPEGHPVLDLEGACEFLELTRSEIMVLVPQALVEIRDKFDLTRQSLDSNDLVDLTRYAHTIKSVAASIGAHAVRHAAETLERHTLAPDPDDCPRLTETLGNEIDALSRAIADLPA